MDPKDDIKKATREKKKKSTKKSTKGKKGAKGKKTKKGVEKSFVQTTPVSSSVPTGTGGITGGRDVLGAGGLPGLLQALGVRGKFQGLGGNTGFGAGALAPIQAPIVQRAPAVEPKLRDVIIEAPEVDREAQRIAENERRLERALRGLTRGDLINRVNAYFGDEGLDYVVKDEILSARTKKGIFERMAEMATRYGNIDIEGFIAFNPEPEMDEEMRSAESVRVQFAPPEEGFRFGIQGAPSVNGFGGGGDDMSALSIPGLEEASIGGDTVPLPEEAD